MQLRDRFKYIAIGSVLALVCLNPEIASAQGYDVQVFSVDGSIEHRCLRDSHHFLTVIEDNGAVVLRPHPGLDPNGWGSSLYLQPFLPDAVLGHSSASVTATTQGIEVSMSGFVSRGTNDTYGPWNGQLSFQYDIAQKHVQGTGNYTITLDGSLAGLGDLNLLKIASNYLDNVPLLTRGVGDTGDMGNAAVVEDANSFTWNPSEQPTFFPQDHTNSISMTVTGQLNNVDTAAQGYESITPAYKPSLQVSLVADQSGIPMIFGAIYDTCKAQQFFADNVGITPLVLQSSSLTQLSFAMTFFSQALPGDGHDHDFDGVLDGVDNCSDVVNVDQADADGDGKGDVCDLCPSTIHGSPVDAQGCPPAIPGDFDRDGDVDSNDLASFLACRSGPAIPRTSGCAAKDFDGDNDVDQEDFGLFQRCYSGSGHPANPSCGN